jgi:hypothetical protein
MSAIVDTQGRPLTRRASADGERCPGCQALIAKVGKVPMCGFGQRQNDLICGACGYEYPS